MFKAYRAEADRNLQVAICGERGISTAWHCESAVEDLGLATADRMKCNVHWGETAGCGERYNSAVYNETAGAEQHPAGAHPLKLRTESTVNGPSHCARSSRTNTGEENIVVWE